MVRLWCPRSARASSAESSWTGPASTPNRGGSHMTWATSLGTTCRWAITRNASWVTGVPNWGLTQGDCHPSGCAVPSGGCGPGGGVCGPPGDCNQPPKDWRSGPAAPGPGKQADIRLYWILRSAGYRYWSDSKLEKEQLKMFLFLNKLTCPCLLKLAAGFLTSLLTLAWCLLSEHNYRRS